MRDDYVGTSTKGAYYGLAETYDSFMGDTNSREPDTAFLTDLRREAWFNARDKSTALLSNLTLAVDAAEGKQTTNMIKNRFKQAVKLIRSVKTNPKRLLEEAHAAVVLGIAGMFHDYSDWSKTSRRDMRRSLRGQAISQRRRQELLAGAADPSNWWLEARLGWGPLIGSLDSALKQAAANLNTSPDYVHRTVSGVEKRNVFVYSGNIKLYGGYFNCLGVQTTTRTVKTNVYMYWKFQKPASLFNHLGSLPEVAWELVPFSFVVDRFVDIGGKIRWEMARSSMTKVAVTGLVEQTHIDRKIDFDKTVTTGYYASSQTVVQSTTDLYSRGPMVDFDLNSISVPLRFDGKHIADYISLFKQLGSNRGRGTTTFSY